MSEAVGELALSVSDLSLEFGGLLAIDNVSAEVEAGSTVGIIGPNGAGKTSFLNCLSGLYKPTRGIIELYGDDITKLPAYQRLGRGLSRTFQHVELPPGTVLESLLTARHHLMRQSIGWSALYVGRCKTEEKDHRIRVRELAEVCGVEGVLGRPCRELNLATQKLVAICRALVSEPRVILLDEPSSGLSPEECGALIPVVETIKQMSGVTVVVVEHNLGVVRRLCDKVIMMNFGRKLADGPVETVLGSAEVRLAYLGR